MHGHHVALNVTKAITEKILLLSQIKANTLLWKKNTLVDPNLEALFKKK
jgi:hypothetical protein